VLVASPPIFAVMAVWLYCKLFNAHYIIDAHTGVFDDPRWRWLGSISRFLARSAAATIVTNVHLQQTVARWGAHAVVIGDVPVDFPAVKPLHLGSGSNVVVVNSFSEDEPLDEILAAAAQLPDVRFHITGNPKHARNRWNATLPANARFTGWLSDADYVGTLGAADVVMCLTTHDHTMQRGAYEAMAMEKPLITSNWELLRTTFSRGTIHVGNIAGEIVTAVLTSIAERAHLRVEMQRLKGERLKVFSASLATLQQRMSTQREVI
jgi:glycosyltransferase involved in cell wall biosynthesis